MRVAAEIVLLNEERMQLQLWARSKTVSVRLARRAQIVLKAADGLDNETIAAQVGVGRVQVGRWRTRYANGGLAAIQKDLPRGGPTGEGQCGADRAFDDADTAHGWDPLEHAQSGGEVGASDTTVLRVWRQHGLKPHRVRTFKVSRDPQFVEKLEDIVGLYMAPPEHALVLCCDQKSQVQALDRRQPGLPLKKGRAATMTHDYKRNGTTTLFAALNVLDGQVIAQCQQRHRHVEWLKFLRQIERETPEDKELHLIADNYATHKHPAAQKWLAKRLAFTCTSRPPRLPG
jgi:DDE superfamily endonuclease/Winged helix-turn helix